MGALDVLVALVLCFVASGLYGSQYIPMRSYKPGDGIFAQWVMCIAIWLTGFASFAYTDFQNFYPVAMLGGAAWCVANILCILNTSVIGLGKTLLINSVVQSVVAFSINEFGLFGTTARPPEIVWLSLLGMAIILVGGVLTSFVKGKPSAKLSRQTLDESVMTISSNLSFEDLEKNKVNITVSSPVSPRDNLLKIAAMIGAVIQGISAALCIVPVVAIQDNIDIFPNARPDGLSYVFSMYCGILLTSTVIFIIYSLFKKNQPYAPPSLILPSMCTGLMWGVAQTLLLIATEVLSQGVTGTVTAMLPASIASIWSLLYFKEIELGKNLYFLYAALTCTLTGAVFIGLSKIDLN